MEPLTKQENQTRFVYLLRDPVTNEPKYIGQARCVISRLGGHLATNTHKIGTCNKKLIDWINGLKEKLLIPKIEVLETTTIDNITERERYWINYWLDQHPILNSAMLKTTPSHNRYWYHKNRRSKNQRIRAIARSNSKAANTSCFEENLI